MEKGKTLLLKVAIILLALPVATLGGFGIFWLLNNPASPNYDQVLYPLVIGLYLTTGPYFFALYQGYQLLNCIEYNHAFSEQSVAALHKIKRAAFTISAIYLVMLPFVFGLAQLDDAPGLVIVGSVPVFASLVVAVFAAVLKKLLAEALILKNDNQLTI